MTSRTTSSTLDDSSRPVHYPTTQTFPDRSHLRHPYPVRTFDYSFSVAYQIHTPLFRTLEGRPGCKTPTLLPYPFVGESKVTPVGPTVTL